MDTKPIYGYVQYPYMVLHLHENKAMEISKIIAANLTAWMSKNPSLDTLKKVAAKSGVGFGTVQRATAGEGNITADKIAAIAAVFGRHPAEMMLDPDGSIITTVITDERYSIISEARHYQANETSPTTNLVSNITQLTLPSEREIAMSELVTLAGNLDMLRLGMLIKTVRDLNSEMPAKQMQRSSD